MAGKEYEIFKLGDWELQSGEKLPDAHLAYTTFGDPSSPAIVYPTWYTGLISDNLWLIGDDKVLSPKKYFIIIPALFGNGQSTSPSNQKHSGPFPTCSFYDNVRAQYKLVTEHFGIKHLRAVIGWSMGGAQTFQWATQFPDFMDLAVPFCGAARTSVHNQVFLEGVKSALLAPKYIPSAGSGKLGLMKAGETVRTWTAEEKEIGLKAFARVYAGWGFSQAFYREKLYESVLGFKNLEDFMQNFWEKWGLSKDPENLLAMLQTWQSWDVSKQAPYNGDFEKALASIKAKTLVMPGKTDLYFPPEDSEYEVACMKPGVGELRVFPSIWGHWAGGPGQSKDDVKWLDEQLAEFFKN
ncbi:homoserine acetyltransferase family protein [Aspergillus clavatus NRRL 1]|uniref:Homoserine acetyltransferase family protein n=1 Tax=Aspergillus clavatus (strain ATCC 1007 / CBS 513.65 / DSM 816 / NCTC 3887 / NRRL 1 / QM 1276 / 107) TaxID=344612 RepID=A1CNS2_ASPCL|nr:homoserine acetyltransferase family protein [Aspergillus clavatus NRRL 1]EAW07293.1 homoserine acetyltransferase family protein [Aspergillus clavatus NRRL 1]